MPRLITIPNFFKGKKYNPKYKDPLITENKRGRIWKCPKGHIIKRKGKYKNTDMSSVHFYCHVCGRVDAKDAIDSGMKR